MDLFSHPLVFGLAATVFGLCIGSFLNVVIHRLPLMMERDWQLEIAEVRGEAPPDITPVSLAHPPSRCPHCGAPIAPWQNIPLLSYALLRGQCAHCKARISLRYPVVELLAGALALGCAAQFGFTLAAAGAMVFCWIMLALAMIDLDTQLLPDTLTLPLLWAGLLINLDGRFTTLADGVIGAAAGYGVLWLVSHTYQLIKKRPGMGAGDFKLLAAIGAWLGWQMLPFVILASSAIGALVGIGLIVFAKHGREVPIPFGPYLAGAGVVALFWGHTITTAYLARL